MPNTMTLISAVTVGSGGAASIDFTSIPQTYTDLCIKLSTRSAYADNYDYPKISFNGVTTNLSCRFIYAYGPTVTSWQDTGIIMGFTNGNASTANTFGSAEIYIPNYTGSTNKSLSIDSVEEMNGTDNRLAFTAGLWSSTAAINAIKIQTTIAGSNWNQNSTAYLYGIKNS